MKINEQKIKARVSEFVSLGNNFLQQNIIIKKR